jgi:hypothetical protein
MATRVYKRELASRMPSGSKVEREERADQIRMPKKFRENRSSSFSVEHHWNKNTVFFDSPQKQKRSNHKKGAATEVL